MFRGRITHLLALLGLLPLVLACSSIVRPNRSASEVFDSMERRLLDQNRVAFEVRSEGAFESSFEGWISREGSDLAMAAEGTWGGEPVAVSVETSRDLLVVNTTDRMERLEREPFIVSAVLIGLARMGVLHNLARVISGRGPDHADGSVREWVRAENITFVGDGDDQIRFDMVVDGDKSGWATVRIDPRSGLPTGREQIVQFPQGTMKVIETYRYEQ